MVDLRAARGEPVVFSAGRVFNRQDGRAGQTG